MPNLRDLFGEVEEAAAESRSFDLDLLDEEFNRAINERVGRIDTPNVPNAPLEVPRETASEPVSEDEPAGEVEGLSSVPPEGVEEPGVEPLSVPAQIAPASPSDPLGSLPPERRAALLALDELLSKDPARSAQLLDRLSQPTEVPQRSEPSLPEEIDPQSFEAQLWHQNLETQRQLAALGDAFSNQRLADERARAHNAAVAAGNSFFSRYAGQLTQDEVTAIAQFAGGSGLASKFVESPEYVGNPQAAYEEALEVSLWRIPALRQKIAGQPSAITPPPPPVNDDRTKRTLSALSAGANPVAGALRQSPRLETREDGRLTPKSREQIISEATRQLMQRPIG